MAIKSSITDTRSCNNNGISVDWKRHTQNETIYRTKDERSFIRCAMMRSIILSLDTMGYYDQKQTKNEHEHRQVDSTKIKNGK